MGWVGDADGAGAEWRNGYFAQILWILVLAISKGLLRLGGDGPIGIHPLQLDDFAFGLTPAKMPASPAARSRFILIRKHLEGVNDGQEDAVKESAARALEDDAAGGGIGDAEQCSAQSRIYPRLAGSRIVDEILEIFDIEVELDAVLHLEPERLTFGILGFQREVEAVTRAVRFRIVGNVFSHPKGESGCPGGLIKEALRCIEMRFDDVDADQMDFFWYDDGFSLAHATFKIAS